MENLFIYKNILIKTRRVKTYSNINKKNYLALLSSSLINSRLQHFKSNSYTQYATQDLLKNLWKFYSRLITNESGLITSNHHKSALFKLVSSSNELKSIESQKYLLNFSTYQFSIRKDTFRKLIMFFMTSLPQQQLCANINFDIYNNYVWLNWHLKLNPMNNVFYLKVYNY